MAVLPRKEIERRRKLDVSNPESFVVTPLMKPDQAFDADSLDLRLGCHFLVPREAQQPFFCPDNKSSNLIHRKLHIPLGKYLVVPAHQTVLGATLEYIKFPYDVSGQILTKSSVARTFIVIATAPWIHPNYRGCLTLEIANVSNTPLLLYPGRLIAQLVLLKFIPKPAKPLRLEETYLGPTLPESPRFKNPEKDLEAIGVKPKNTLVIPAPRWADEEAKFQEWLAEQDA